jgi:hypothetical protein
VSKAQPPPARIASIRICAQLVTPSGSIVPIPRPSRSRRSESRYSRAGSDRLELRKSLSLFAHVPGACRATSHTSEKTSRTPRQTGSQFCPDM